MLRRRKLIVFNNLKYVADRGFTLIETVIQLALLLLVITILPLVIKFSANMDSTKEARQEAEWEFAMNEIYRLVREYDAVSVDPNKKELILYYIRLDPNTNEYIIGIGPKVLISNGGIRLKDNSGYEPISTNMGVYSLDISHNQLIIRHTNSKGIKKERRFYVKVKQ